MVGFDKGLVAFVALAATGAVLSATLTGGDTARAAGEWRRAALRIDGGEIPFFLQLPAAKGEGEAIIRNGAEEIAVQCTVGADGVVLDFPHYDSRITAEWAAGNMLVGTWEKTVRGGESRTLEFYATPPGRYAPRSRFSNLTRGESHGTDAPMLESGRWRIDFAESGPAIGVFEAMASPSSVDHVQVVEGTILTPTGDYRYLAGVAVNGRVRLSVFDGAHAFLFSGDLDPTGQSMVGTFHSGDHFTEAMTARRLSEEDPYELPDAFSQVSLRPGETRLRLPMLDEAPYAGAPTIVQVFGTWCPNCNDEAPVLKSLYDRFHGDGLQILGLAYEHTEGDDRALEQIERFKQRHGVQWTIVAAGLSDKSMTSATLPAMSDIKSYPTTIFINRDGTVRAIHSGFAGPATGEAHERLVAEFERLTREIVGGATG